MANVQNPKNFVITPGAGVEGAAVSDYTIAYAAAPGNSPPAGFPVGAPQVLVPAKDLTPQADGTILVPIPDIVTNTLAPGTYAADCAANSTAAGTESAFTAPVFFDITAPVPAVPGFGVA